LLVTTKATGVISFSGILAGSDVAVLVGSNVEVLVAVGVVVWDGGKGVGVFVAIEVGVIIPAREHASKTEVRAAAKPSLAARRKNSWRLILGITFS
jgi:hypothetical protein